MAKQRKESAFGKIPNIALIVLVLAFAITFIALNFDGPGFKGDDWSYLSLAYCSITSGSQCASHLSVSTFFFVYIGLIFSFGTVNLYEILVALAFVAVIVLVRIVMTPMLRGIISKDKNVRKVERSLIWFNMPGGLSSVIIATLLIGYSFAVTPASSTLSSCLCSSPT